MIFVILVSVCIAFQLAPRPPNVEITSLTVFLAGAVFGVFFGVGLGVLVLLINGFVSPWGFAGLILPFQVIGIAIVGLGAGLYRFSRGGSYDSASYAETAVLGAFLTLVYDIVTNLGFAVIIGNGRPDLFTVIGVLVAGAIFSAIHVVSNAVIFGLVFVPISKAIKSIGGERTWKREPLPM
jgi:hypothetical protein